MLTVGDPEQASKLLPRIRGLEQYRLQVAAFYETELAALSIPRRNPSPSWISFRSPRPSLT